MSAQSLLSDLVRDSKIETQVLESGLQHTFYETGRSARERHVPREERWVRQALVGRGAYGTVYLEKCESGDITKLRAVKEIKKWVVPGEELDYMRELEAVAKFSHQNYSHCFVQSHGWFEIGDSIFISMEYLDHGDLQRYLTQPLPEVESIQIISQILEGLHLMHENGFAHRDLKPGNIMVVTKTPDWFVKIADFGISKRRLENVTTFHTLQRGTFGFAAPEVLGCITSTNSYTFSVDMWSLGAVAHKVLTNTTVFQNIGELFRYSNETCPFPTEALNDNNVTQQAQDLIFALMKPDPEERLCTKTAMAHPWIAGKDQFPTEKPMPEAESRPHFPASREVLTADASISTASKAWSWSTAGTPVLPTQQTVLDQQKTLQDVSEHDAGRSLLGTGSENREITAHGNKYSNYQPPSVSDCLDEDEYRIPSLHVDSATILEAVQPGVDVQNDGGESVEESPNPNVRILDRKKYYSYPVRSSPKLSASSSPLLRVAPPDNLTLYGSMESDEGSFLSTNMRNLHGQKSFYGLRHVLPPPTILMSETDEEVERQRQARRERNNRVSSPQRNSSSSSWERIPFPPPLTLRSSTEMPILPNPFRPRVSIRQEPQHRGFCQDTAYSSSEDESEEREGRYTDIRFRRSSSREAVHNFQGDESEEEVHPRQRHHLQAQRNYEAWSQMRRGTANQTGNPRDDEAEEEVHPRQRPHLQARHDYEAGSRMRRGTANQTGNPRDTFTGRESPHLIPNNTYDVPVPQQSGQTAVSSEFPFIARNPLLSSTFPQQQPTDWRYHYYPQFTANENIESLIEIGYPDKDWDRRSHLGGHAGYGALQGMGMNKISLWQRNVWEARHL